MATRKCAPKSIHALTVGGDQGQERTQNYHSLTLCVVADGSWRIESSLGRIVTMHVSVNNSPIGILYKQDHLRFFFEPVFDSKKFNFSNILASGYEKQ
jgi:hypothetical protein